MLLTDSDSTDDVYYKVIEVCFALAFIVNACFDDWIELCHRISRSYVSLERQGLQRVAGKGEEGAQLFWRV